jgi:hypothetical protein
MVLWGILVRSRTIYVVRSLAVCLDAAAAYGFYAGDRHLCGLGRRRQRRGPVEESVVPADDEETEVGQ